MEGVRFYEWTGPDGVKYRAPFAETREEAALLVTLYDEVIAPESVLPVRRVPWNVPGTGRTGEGLEP